MRKRRHKVQEAGPRIDWLPSAPRFGATHVVYTRNRVHDRLMVVTFRAAYAARRWIDMVIQDHKYLWVKDKGRPVRDRPTIETDDGIEIASDQLEEIMETEAPEDFELPTPYPSWVSQLRREEEPETLQQIGVGVSKHRQTGGKATAAIAASRGMVSITEIAQSLGMPPSDARATLRKKRVPKPPGGWAWSKEEADEIKKMLEG